MNVSTSDLGESWTVVDVKRDWKTVLPEMKEQAK
jgi:hypothetical protein